MITEWSNPEKKPELTPDFGQNEQLANPLSQSERRLANAQKITHIGNWDLDMANNLLYWSDEIYRIFGISRANFTPCYETFYNAIHPDDRAAWIAHRNLFLKGSIPMNMEHRIVLATGEIRYVHELGERIVDTNNRLIWLRGTVQDITEHRAINKKLENLSPIAKQTSNPVIVVDINGKITWVNNAFVRTFEYEARGVIGKKPGTFLQGPETDLAAMRYLLGKIKKEERFEVELLLYSKTGQKFWMLVQGQPIFDKTGNCTSFLTIQHHMIGRKLAQERINGSEKEERHLFHQNPNPMWIFDYETLYFIEVNDAAIRHYGYSLAEFRQMKITDIRPELRMEKKGAREGSASKDIENRSTWTHVTKDGKSIFVEVTAHEIDYRGRKAVLLLANDVTEKMLRQKRVGEELILKQRAGTETVVEKIYISSIKVCRDNLHSLLAKSVSLVSNAISALRKLFKALAAPGMKELQLYSAVDTLIDQITDAKPMTILFDTEMFYEDGLTKEVKLNVFRIIQGNNSS